MDAGRYLVEAHLREGRAIGELARVHGVHRSWLYKLLARYRREGDAGLARARVGHTARPQRWPPRPPRRSFGCAPRSWPKDSMPAR